MHSRIGWRRAVAAFVLLVAAAGLVPGQFNPNPRVPAPTRPGFGESTNLDPLSEAKRMKALNADRHKSMVSDTEKLLKLARQLDAEIASNSTDGLTPQEVQKLAAIEKLAHNVKTKMAQSFGGGPELKSPILDIPGPSAQ